MRRCLMIALIFSLGLGLPAAAAPAGAARNVIFFIGDGMGPAQVTGGRLFKGGSAAHLAMEDLGVTGISRTYSTDNFVTDSAAGVTALACGVKTYNSAIGMTDRAYDPTGTSRRLQNLAQLARAQGKSIGVLTTARVTDATPAGYYAQVANRGMEAQIADQIASSGLTLLMGGGREWFHPRAWQDPASGSKGKRRSGDTAAQLQAAGWTLAQNAEELAALDPAQKNLRVLGLFSIDSMAYDLERGGTGQPSIEAMTEFAVKLLARNPKGFFLMVEGGLIDHGGHENNPAHIFGDLNAFDRAIGWAHAHAPQDTLIAVTADHETGALGLNGYAPREAVRGNGVLGRTGAHGEGHPIVSFGSGTGTTATLLANVHYNPAYPLAGSGAHSAVDVEIFSGGPGSERLTGVMDNSEIPWRIAAAMGATFTSPANVENRKAHLNAPKNLPGAAPAAE